jgi:rubrerythrin
MGWFPSPVPYVYLDDWRECVNKEQNEMGPYEANERVDQELYRDSINRISAQPSITCPQCGMTSYNPTDIAEGYCGNCHDWTSPGSTRHGRV